MGHYEGVMSRLLLHWLINLTLAAHSLLNIAADAILTRVIFKDRILKQSCIEVQKYN